MDKYWRNETTAGKAKNVALLLAVIAFMILLASSMVEPQGSTTVLSYALGKLLIFFTGLTILSFSVYYQKQHDESVQPKAKPIDDSENIYIPEISTLITCSHNLDKVRSNLRAGIIFIFGIGTALVVWLLNLGSMLDDLQAILFLGSGFLVLCTIVAILFSFSNPIVRLNLKNIGEGLVSTEMTQNEYRDVLVTIINEKEFQLGRMREVMQLGLMMLILIVTFELMSNSLLQTPPQAGDSMLIGGLAILNLLSTLILVFGLVMAIAVIFGRALLGLAK